MIALNIAAEVGPLKGCAPVVICSGELTAELGLAQERGLFGADAAELVPVGRYKR